MPSVASYLLGAAQIALVALSLGFTAYRLRGRFLPSWEGAPARLVEVVAAIALLIWLSEILGTVGLLYAGALVLVSVVIAASAAAFLPAGEARAEPPAAPAGRDVWSLVVMVGVVALVVGHWAVTTKHALDRGIFNFDSLWYHQPFAADIFQSHSTTGMLHVETVFTNWFYPQNSELLHAVGMVLTGRDTLSLFVNLGWLGIAFLAAWCIGRPYGRGPLTVTAAAILLECHTLVVRDPGAAKNDLAAAALILAAIAILVTAWNATRRGENAESPGMREEVRTRDLVGWPLAAAGVAVGLAAGTRVTALPMAAALSLMVLVLAPAGRRWAAAAWWFLPAFAAGGYWYLRNLVVAGNPLPEIGSIGPVSLPHPERLQEGRPDFSIAHYATDTAVWRDYFGPALHEAFGGLWPLVLAAALGAALLALFKGRDKVLRWVGAVALFGMLAHLFTPLSAAGADGEPVGFGINIRYVVPALLAGIVLLPLPRFFDDRRRQWGLLGALVVVLLVTDRPDVPARDAARLFALLLATLVVLVPAALLLARSRGASRGLLVGGCAALALAVVALGYPAQRHYLDGRFANDGAPQDQIPGMDLDSAYRWARSVEDARIGLAGTTAGFAGYGFYGSDLSNRVRYLGAEGPHGAFNAIPDCGAFRAAVNAADLDYLVTAPFLNFLHPGEPIPSPEARWLRGEDAVEPVLRSGPVTVWRVEGELDPGGCDSANAPLRQVPDTPAE
ncbi:MAG TPA: hypothetical protein VFX45_02640 [Solirubrobacterales bacterium]|nr:hypothetical protein [Solirubrobacterales bacterium]